MQNLAQRMIRYMNACNGWVPDARMRFASLAKGYTEEEYTQVVKVFRSDPRIGIHFFPSGDPSEFRFYDMTDEDVAKVRMQLAWFDNL